MASGRKARDVRPPAVVDVPPTKAFKTIAASPVRRAATALVFSVVSALFLGFHPGSLKFWDSGHGHYWRTLYVPGERPREFAKVADVIPAGARVASTDFVHPRYTHCERSYDYSNYVRQVAGYADKVPDDADYIVIDTRHPYSEIHTLDQVRELRTQSEQWEVVPNDTNGYFIILKRRET